MQVELLCSHCHSLNLIELIGTYPQLWSDPCSWWDSQSRVRRRWTIPVARYCTLGQAEFHSHVALPLNPNQMMGQAAVKSMSEVGRLTPNRQHCRCSRCCCCWSCCSSPDCPWQPRLLVAVDRPDDGVSATFTCLAFAPCSFPKTKTKQWQEHNPQKLARLFCECGKNWFVSLSLSLSPYLPVYVRSLSLFLSLYSKHSLSRTHTDTYAMPRANTRDARNWIGSENVKICVGGRFLFVNSLAAFQIP